MEPVVAKEQARPTPGESKLESWKRKWFMKRGAYFVEGNPENV